MMIVWLYLYIILSFWLYINYLLDSKVTLLSKVRSLDYFVAKTEEIFMLIHAWQDDFNEPDIVKGISLNPCQYYNNKK